MRPTYRPKHERRKIEKRGARPQRNYTSGTRGKQPPSTRFIEMPPNRFKMPPMDEEPKGWKPVAKIFAAVIAGFAVMYAITWVYGHFRWGW